MTEQAMGQAVERVVQRRPVVVTRVVRLVWALVLLAAAITVLAVVLDDEILRSTSGIGVSVDDTRVPPSFTPVIVVLDVVVSSLVVVLLAFVNDGHNWARHCLATTFALLAVATAAMLRTGPPLAFVPPVVLWLVLDALLLHLLYRPATTQWVTPRVLAPSA